MALFAKHTPDEYAADRGHYSCFTEQVTHWHGEEAGQTETLEPGEYELRLNTETGDCHTMEFGETVSLDSAYEFDFRPNGRPELVARRADNAFTLRIRLEGEPMRFAGVGPKSVLTGICHFEPRTNMK